jgi:ABC-type sugar transport system ATPase subunit
MQVSGLIDDVHGDRRNRTGSAGRPVASKDVVSRLALRGVGKSFGAVKALADVEMDVRPGEVVALLGENGAGKSTLVKIIAGLLRPDAGTIEIGGEEVSFHSSAAAQSHGVVLVTQEFSLVPSMTVAENLVLGQVGSSRIWRRRKLVENARRLLVGVGLEDLDPNERVASLGVAERQLIEIARGLGRDANLLILDEPTAALADDAIERVLLAVTRLSEAGHSIIYVTHRLNEVARVCDRVQIMRNGRSLPPVATESTSVDGIVRMMLGRELGDLFPDRSAAEDEPKLVLEARDLSAPGLTKPISIAARRGEIVGLTGQIGSGAEATLRALAGLERIGSGTVTINGEDTDLRDRQAGLRQGIAYCSADRQRDGIFARMSVRENLSSAWLSQVAQAGWVSRRSEKERAEETAEGFAIDLARMGDAAGNLSGGNQQKVALGRWLGIDPAVLLADEPTRGVDVGARAEIYRRLRALASNGVAVVLASTDTAEVLGLCDRIVTFYRGEVTGDRPFTEWTEAQLAESVMHKG